METSAINSPHPDSAPDEADLFFGGEEEGKAAAPQPAEDKSGGWPDLTPEEQAKGAAEYREHHGEPEPLHEQAPGQSSEPAVIGDPPSEQPEPAQGGEASQPQAGSSEPNPAPSGEGSSKQAGTVEREYIVFHEIALTKRVLEHLLQQLAEGADARVAHFEIHRVTTRNVNHAVGAAYTKHKDKLGPKARLSAVSSKSFQSRTVEPRPVEVEPGLSIK